MKSYYVELTGIGKSEVKCEDIAVTDLKDNEALIKAEYSLISAGTELSRAFGLKKGFSYPVRPGYSAVGRVMQAGKDLDLVKGQRVFVNCPHASLIRWSRGKNVQEPMIIALPEDIDPIEATALNLMFVALQGVNLSEVRLGDKVAVFGLGNIGIITALLYKKLGADVTGFDVEEGRLKLAEKLGIKSCINNEEEAAKLPDFDICVDVSGLSPVIMNAIAKTRRYGQVLLLGSPRQSYETDITLAFSQIHMKNLRVIGAFNQTVPLYPTAGSNNSLQHNFETIITLLRNRDLDISKLITKIVDPKDCEKAYYDLMYSKSENSGIVFDWRNY
jgi:2-desacetyl-2-hydroxyethyl bacteriochlorophyllide A dehydrogenase